MEDIRTLLNAECSYRMKDETMDRFLGLMTELKLKRNQNLIPCGKCDPDVYIVRKGIISASCFDGSKERTHGFALPGSMIVSHYSFYGNEPSFSKFFACCPSSVVRVGKADFDKLVEESHDFAKWVMTMYMLELLYIEKKRQVVNGDAKEKFASLIINRPEIIENVTSRIIASYIGITPQYLSKLKREFSERQALLTPFM